MTAVTRTVRSIDLPLGPGRRTLRLSIVEGEDGTPEAVIFALGFGEGPEFLRPGWCDAPFALPADAIPKLRAALEALGASP